MPLPDNPPVGTAPWDGFCNYDCRREYTKEYERSSGIVDKPEPKAQIAVVNVDHAEYIGDPDDGVYYQVAKGPDEKWYGSALVDCNTGSFVDSLVTDDGPYDYEGQAETAMADAAKQWCFDNDVNFEDEEGRS
jgi:hypothetical protein